MSNIDYAAVNRAALPLCPGLLESLLPGGTTQGREYQCSDLSGGGGDSLRVNMDTGKWADFAAGDEAKGGDLVSLVAAIKSVNQPEAAKVLSEMAGVASPTSTTAKRQQKDSKPAAIVPVPDGIKPPASFKHFRLGEPAATWEYRDVSGRLLGYVGRFNKEEADSKGKLKKDFCPMVYTSQGWRWQGFPEPRPLYGLHRLAQAAPAASVLLVEGEGKADALQEVLGTNVAVLSLCGGAKAVAKLDFSPLQNRKVIYWPDADEPGAKAALLVCTNVKLAGAASVAVAVPPDGVPEGWDGADAIKGGWDRDRLTTHIKESCITHEAFIDVAASRWGVDVDAMARPDTSDGADGSSESEQESRLLPPPPPVPLEAFPAPVAALLEEAAAAFSASLQIVAACFLAFLSCLVGRSRLISIKEGWEEAANLWIVSVAVSGSGKSPCMAAFFRVITRLEYQAKQIFDDAYSAYETELVLYQVQRNLQAKEKAKGKDVDAAALIRPEEPKQRQTTADDVTVEALGNILQANPKGVLWLKDELSGLIFDLDKYSGTGGGGGTKARLLSSHSLGAWKTTRSSNPNRNNFIPKACVGIFGGIQPGIMGKVFEAGTGGMDVESGFLPRFLFIRAVAEAPSYWTDRSFSRGSISLLERIASTLWSWDIEHDDKGWEIDKIVPVSRQAKARYVEWYNAIAAEAYLSQNSALLRKLQAHALRLCLLLHSLDAALTGNNGMGLVTDDTMRRALLLADWAKEHQEQCWRFFTPEKGAKQADPIESTIMQVVVEEAERIAADGWRISNADLCSLVEAKLNMPGISSVKIGRAASSLGLGQCKVNRNEKGRSVSRELIDTFRSTVRSDRTDRMPHGSRENLADGCNFDPTATDRAILPTWAQEGAADALRTDADGTRTDTDREKSIGTQGLRSERTVRSDVSGDTPVFDFNDPAFPDEDRVEI